MHDALVYYHNCNTKKMLFVNVVSQVIWNKPKLTSQIQDRKDRFKKGGGVALFVPKILALNERPDLKISDCYRKKINDVRKLSSNRLQGPCTAPAWAIEDCQTISVPHLTYILYECIEHNISPDCNKNFKPTVIQLRLHFWTMQFCTCTG